MPKSSKKQDSEVDQTVTGGGGKAAIEKRTRKKVQIPEELPGLSGSAVEDAQDKAEKSRRSVKSASKAKTNVESKEIEIETDQLSTTDATTSGRRSKRSGSALKQAGEAHPVSSQSEAAPPAKKPKGKQIDTGETEKAVKKGDMPSPKRQDSEKTLIAKSPIERNVPKGRTFKLISWNVTTLRSLVNKNSNLLKNLFNAEKPDLVCIQETKLNPEDHEEYELKLRDILPDYSFHWNSCTLQDSKSYSGTLAIARGGTKASGSGQKVMDSFLKPAKSIEGESATVSEKVLGVTMGLPTLTDADGEVAKEVIQEGRTITVEYEKFYVVASYVPNSGDKLQRLDFRTKVWDRRMGEYLVSLEKKKPVIFCGDLNVAHLDADIWNAGAKHLVKSAGTTPAERQSFSELLGLGFVDAFRHLNPAATGWYSYWSVRAGNLPFNRGLRLDYFVTSPKLIPAEGGEASGAAVADVAILPDFVALDHAAVALTLAL